MGPGTDGPTDDRDRGKGQVETVCKLQGRSGLKKIKRTGPDWIICSVQDTIRMRRTVESLW
jgi:hypothetical protein